MKGRCYKWAVIILLSVNVIIGVIILCRIYPRIIAPNNLGIDYIGLIVGILAMLTAILIGWQIWNIIDFDKKVSAKIKEDREALKKEIITQFNDELNHYDKKIGSTMFHAKANSTSDKRIALYCFFYALKLSNEAGTYVENQKRIIEDLCMTMHTTKSEDIPIDDISLYINVINELKNVDNSPELSSIKDTLQHWKERKDK